MWLGQYRDANTLIQRHTDNCHSVWKGKHTRADDLCDHERGDELWRAQVSVHSPHYISTERTDLPASSESCTVYHVALHRQTRLSALPWKAPTRLRKSPAPPFARCHNGPWEF